MGNPRRPLGSSQLPGKPHFSIFCILLPTMACLRWLKLWTDIGGGPSIELWKQSTNNVWPVRSMILEKQPLSPEAWDLLTLDPLNTCSWISFNYQLVWVINIFLLWYVCFLDGLKLSFATWHALTVAKRLLANTFSTWVVPSIICSDRDTHFSWKIIQA